MTGTIAWTGGMLFTFLIGKSADVCDDNPPFVALDLVGLWCCGGCIGGERHKRSAIQLINCPSQ
jgi:hypothetical protein